ncbi:MAG: VOC family protein [Planctomycetota bacterium]|jgi:predicted enzyme related to lactoylglutathione lyase
MGNPLVHFEFMTDDEDKCRAFYGSVFDWEFDASSMPGYTLIKTGTDPSGGLMKRPAESPSTALNVYFEVDDVEAVLAKVTSAGGTVLVPKTPIPNVGAFGMFADPENNCVGVFQQ